MENSRSIQSMSVLFLLHCTYCNSFYTILLYFVTFLFDLIFFDSKIIADILVLTKILLFICKGYQISLLWVYTENIFVSFRFFKKKEHKNNHIILTQN